MKNQKICVEQLCCRDRGKWSLGLHNRLIITFSGTTPAQGFRTSPDLALEIDALTALCAHNALTFVSGKLLRRKLYMDPLGLKKLLVRNFTISQHLLLVLVFNLGMHGFCQRL